MAWGMVFTIWAVGMSLGPHLVPAAVASAAPISSSTMQERKTPNPAQKPTPVRLTSGRW